ncbi:hypothetical protein ACCO45_004673 [Purpureocillium lilacinum]|uniref:Uncharacterized protein n=1 Tax=Purpureocillium lilacinum TaxID=33203 RepID=A0ACC4DTH0_PURLI
MTPTLKDRLKQLQLEKDHRVERGSPRSTFAFITSGRDLVQPANGALSCRIKTLSGSMSPERRGFSHVKPHQEPPPSRINHQCKPGAASHQHGHTNKAQRLRLLARRGGARGSVPTPGLDSVPVLLCLAAGHTEMDERHLQTVR